LVLKCDELFRFALFLDLPPSPLRGARTYPGLTSFLSNSHSLFFFFFLSFLFRLSAQTGLVFSQPPENLVQSSPVGYCCVVVIVGALGQTNKPFFIFIFIFSLPPSYKVQVGLKKKSNEMKLQRRNEMKRREETPMILINGVTISVCLGLCKTIKR